jgi:Animal haem peroxidase
MERLSHGSFLSASNPPAPVQPGDSDLKVAACPAKTNFSYLFQELQDDPDARLPAQGEDGKSMAETLKLLGDAMTDPTADETVEPNVGSNSDIPAIYTYFGQFITHEVVFAPKTPHLGTGAEPLAPGEIPNLVNGRSALLDLDSIYGPIIQKQEPCFEVPRINGEMELGFALGCPVGTDLKRQLHKDPLYTAKIGDGRNDANRITSQMHLAFLRAHNAFVKAGNSFEDAQRLLRQHFQWLVIHEYLPRVVDNAVLQSVLDGDEERDIFRPADDKPSMPVEFSAAAFRFGHSMARNRYNYNHDYDKQRLSDFFLPNKTVYPPITKEWIIDWKRFLPGGLNFARRIDTRLVQPLFDRLIDEHGDRILGSNDKIISLAALDLLRGYSLGLPTGQKVATALGITPILAPDIESAAGVSEAQKTILQASGLSSKTPLWFYVLVEAAALGNGLRLGPVGSTIVAGVLVGLVRCSKDSILRDPNFGPALGNGHFDLAELFRFAGVLTT